MMDQRPDPVDGIRRLDPIDGVRLAASWADSDAKTALLQEITAMPVDTLTPVPKDVPTPTHTRSRTARRSLAFAAALTIAAISLAIAPGLLADNGTTAFAVRELPNGVLEIDASRGSVDVRDGHALAAELREYGIDVEVTTLLASPSMVGTVDVFGPDWDLHEGIPPGLSYGQDGTPEVFHYTIDPAVFRDTITIQIAVETEAGQPYELLDGAFEPGEVLDGLHCAIGHPLRADALVPYLDELGLAPVWHVVSPTDDPNVTSSRIAGDVPEGEVMSALPVDASTIGFEVTTDRAALPSPSWPDVFEDGEPCTPERAAAWG